MIRLQKFIDHERKEALPADRIKSFVFRQNFKTIEYNHLSKSDTCAKLLPHEVSGLLLLYDNSKRPEIGHFVLLYRARGAVHYFDPTGYKLRRMTELTGNTEVLAHILGNETGKVTFSSVKYQRVRGDTQTCGRHVATRYNFATFTDEEYHGLMTYKGIPYDDLVTLLTLPNDLAHWQKVIEFEKKK